MLYRCIVKQRLTGMVVFRQIHQDYFTLTPIHLRSNVKSLESFPQHYHCKWMEGLTGNNHYSKKDVRMRFHVICCDHPCLVYILFSIPSRHPFTLLNVFVVFLQLVSFLLKTEDPDSRSKRVLIANLCLSMGSFHLLVLGALQLR